MGPLEMLIQGHPKSPTSTSNRGDKSLSYCNNGNLCRTRRFPTWTLLESQDEPKEPSDC